MAGSRASAAGNGEGFGLGAPAPAEEQGSMENVGLALRWLRQRRQQKQHEVAEAAGITRPMLSAYERGKVKPTLDTLEGILAALGCDLAQLAGALRVVCAEIPPGLGEGERGPEPAAGKAPAPASAAERVAAREAEAFRSLKKSLLNWLDVVREHALDPEMHRGDDIGAST